MLQSGQRPKPWARPLTIILSACLGLENYIAIAELLAPIPMLLYFKLIYAYINPGTGRLTEVQDSFLSDGWSQLSWTFFLVASGQTKAGSH